MENAQRDSVLGKDGIATPLRPGKPESPAEPAYDRLTSLAARLLDVPIALIALADGAPPFFKSRFGLAETDDAGSLSPQAQAFCLQVIAAGEPLRIESAAGVAQDIFACAGIPLILADGQTIGVFCVLDRRSHWWTPGEIETLTDLAASAVTAIELHLTANAAQERAAIVAREREEKLALLESTSEGIYGIDTEGCFTFMNNAAAGMTRYEPEAVLGKNAHTLLHHSHQDGTPYLEEQCPIYRAFHRGEGCRIADEVMWRSDGTSFPVEYTSSPIIMNGEIQGAVVSMVNITRRKQLEQLRDDLVDMIVHDLRTPLTSLLTGLQTLECMSLDPDQTEVLDIAMTGGKTLLALINDLLDVSKMENGSIALERQETAPDALAQQALGQVEMLARQKGVTLRMESEPHLPPLYADADKLQRTLVNLLGNALKFTPSGGDVRLLVRPDKAESSILFSVHDTGEGIPETAFARIFEKFGQVESRQAGRKMSTGLGLTFCKMAVEAHGGRIWVESKPGKGSTFSFCIPLGPKNK